jgi:hypothetical protein
MYLRKLRITLVAIGSLLIVGCADSSTSTVKGQYDISSFSKDGTYCIGIKTAQGGVALDCNFKDNNNGE